MNFVHNVRKPLHMSRQSSSTLPDTRFTQNASVLGTRMDHTAIAVFLCSTTDPGSQPTDLERLWTPPDTVRVMTTLFSVSHQRHFTSAAIILLPNFANALSH